MKFPSLRPGGGGMQGFIPLRPASPSLHSRRRLSPHASPAVFFVLLEDEVIGHTGDVVADDAGKRFFLGFLLVVTRESLGIFHPESEKFADDPLGVVFFVGQAGAEVDGLVQKIFGLLSLGINLRAESCDTLRMIADPFQRLNIGLVEASASVSDKVIGEAVEDALEDLVEFQFFGRLRVEFRHFAIEALENRYALANVL